MAAFTVKATYRSETRKFSFPDNVFPTYEQLYSQVSTDYPWQPRVMYLPQLPIPVVSGLPHIPLVLSIEAPLLS